ncbi:conserved hypothetical protein [Ricinus communis]|uniref:Uncharacterized protein n=1 Tax=Ricinus communis TaxID=3988 RepID=B9TKW7_RICCO|nr:conserved hypothetical protein [Ricinus communis]
MGFVRQAGATIADADLHRRRRPCHADGEITACAALQRAQRIERIAHQVQQHLLQPVAVA